MEPRNSYSYSCTSLPPQPQHNLELPEEASTDCFSIDFTINHHQEYEIYDQELSFVHSVREEEVAISSEFILSCQSLLSDDGPALLQTIIFNHQFMPESLRESGTPVFIAIGKQMFDKVIQRRNSAEYRQPHPQPVIMPMKIMISVFTTTIILDTVQERRTIPASKEVIQLLKKVNLFHEGSVVKEGSCCSICLEEFTHGGVELACSHVYHQDCIVQWLKISNVCPLCRYHLP